MKHLSGENFASLAGIIYQPSTLIPDTGIVYCHVNYVHSAFDAIRIKPGPFVLISSQGDFSTVQHYLDAIPENLLKWFTVGAEPFNGRTQGIPLGIADSYYNSGNFDSGQWHLIEAEMSTIRDIQNLLHVRMCITTNGDRQNAYEAVVGRPWAHVNIYHNFAQRPLNFQQYLEELHKFKFTLAPNGGGIDTHRVWEALYLDVIPICRRQPELSWFETLPICWIDSWDEVTEAFLDSEYERIKGHEWDMEMLWLDYWEQMISEVFQH